MGAKFYIKIFVTLTVAIILGYFIVNCYLEHVENVKRNKHRINVIQKFADNTFVHIEQRGSKEDPVVKVSLKLENILHEGIEPVDDKNIFFIDSSHVLKNPPKTVNDRELCSFESAARSNPSLNVYVVFISPKHKMTLEMTKPLSVLQSYKNIHFVLLKMTPFSKGTTAEKFIASDKLKQSAYPLEHTSDVFRLLLLYKYGGFYLDSDMIVKKSLDQLGTNFGCTEGEQGIISNAFLHFDRKKGRKLVESFMSDQLENFNATAWGFNGPQSLSKVVTKMCDGLETNKLKSVKTCGDFHIHPRRLCFPILPTNYDKIFMRNFTKILMKRSKNAVTVHMWNGLTKNIKTTKTEKNFYTQLANNFCPKVFAAIESEF